MLIGFVVFEIRADVQYHNIGILYRDPYMWGKI